MHAQTAVHADELVVVSSIEELLRHVGVGAERGLDLAVRDVVGRIGLIAGRRIERGQLVQELLNLGLNALAVTHADIIRSREIEAGDGAVTLRADIGHGNLGHHAAVRHVVAHLEGVATRLGKRRVRAGNHLHVTGGTGVGDHVGVRSAGNLLAIGDGVDAFEHVALRTVMRAKGGTTCPVPLAQRIFRHHVGHGTVAAVMAFHAETTAAGIRHCGAIGERHIVAHAQLVRIGIIVRVMAGLAVDRIIGRVRRITFDGVGRSSGGIGHDVGGRGIRPDDVVRILVLERHATGRGPTRETGRGVAADALRTAGAGRRPGGSRME